MLRWEYRPGSVLYFVWTQERDATTEALGDLRFGPSTRRLLDAQAERHLHGEGDVLPGL